MKDFFLPFDWLACLARVPPAGGKRSWQPVSRLQMQAPPTEPPAPLPMPEVAGAVEAAVGRAGWWSVGRLDCRFCCLEKLKTIARE